MTGIGEKREVNERALLKSFPDALTRSLVPDAWPVFPDDELIPSQRVAESVRGRIKFEGICSNTLKSLSSAFDLEFSRGLFFLLLPVFCGFGAIVYFALPVEPVWLPILVILSFFMFFRVVARKRFLMARLLTLAIAIMLGIVAGKFETERKNTPILGSDVATWITARVVALEYRDNETWRLTLDLLDTERPKLRYAPDRVRITARDIPANTIIGSGLQGFARLRVPSGPVRPGNYDFAFHAFFNGIGANGFFLGVPKLVDVPNVGNMSEKISLAIAALRVRIAERINEVLPDENGNVAAALIAGERAGISEETNEDLRKSGLAHILSISGLHMALAAGVVMLTLRSLFAFFPAFSARHPVKKYAAFLSLLSCTFYLAMSGMDVAAQRSYIMIAVMLCALLLDRAAISMRNLAIAALAMIIIRPHEILGPSFQMSFSATAALIAAFAWWSSKQASQQSRAEAKDGMRKSLAAKIIYPVLITAGTSLVAGIASGIFAAYHFNNTAPLGLVGNVLALPVISVLVMPFGVLSLLTMPLQLDWLPLQIMGFGIELVRVIARYVAYISPDGNPGVMPFLSLALWTIALVIFVAFTSRLRWAAVVFVLAGFFVFMRTPLPDILISEDASFVAVRLEDGDYAVNRKRPPRFIADNWQMAYLINSYISPRQAEKPHSTFDQRIFICEDGVCLIELRDGRMLAYSADEAMHEVACHIGDIVILAIPGVMPTCDKTQSLVIGKQELALKGTLELRLGARDGKVSSTLETMPVNEIAEPYQPVSAYSDNIIFSVGAPVRPWHLHRLYSRPARGLPERSYQKKTTKIPTIPAG